MLINKFFLETINMKKSYTSPERGPALLKKLKQFFKSANGPSGWAIQTGLSALNVLYLSGFNIFQRATSHLAEHLQMFSSTLSMLKSFKRAKSLLVEHVKEL